MKLIILLSLLTFALSTWSIFPKPYHQVSINAPPFKISHPCQLFLTKPTNINFDTSYYFQKIINRLTKNQGCTNQNQDIQVLIQMQQSIVQQGYNLIIKNKLFIIEVSSYAGYVYGMESLSQIITNEQIELGTIKDMPLVQHRGIMIDSVRHFISLSYVQKLIEVMPLSKLNILHWHLSDDETFPILLIKHPQLATDSIYSPSQVYTIDALKKIIALAAKNSIQIIPQIDTPAHVRSWGLSKIWKDKQILITCGGGQGYNGQFDLSKPQVYALAGDVIAQINEIFQDSPYIHLGGDQVGSKCWDLRPAIKDFMQSKGINSYGELQMYWRSEMRKRLPQNRKVVFWRNNAQSIVLGKDDILHFWGAQKDISTVVSNSTSKIILSPSDYLYINTGQGFIWANTFGTYSVWKNIYQNMVVFPQGVDKTRILGAQVCLWGEVSNEDTLENNLWMRSAAFAARVWSEPILPIHEIIKDLIKLQKTLEQLGVEVSPITSQYCENHVDVCFGEKENEVQILAIE